MANQILKNWFWFVFIPSSHSRKNAKQSIDAAIRKGMKHPVEWAKSRKWNMFSRSLTACFSFNTSLLPCLFWETILVSIWFIFSIAFFESLKHSVEWSNCHANEICSRGLQWIVWIGILACCSAYFGIPLLCQYDLYFRLHFLKASNILLNGQTVTQMKHVLEDLIGLFEFEY